MQKSQNVTSSVQIVTEFVPVFVNFGKIARLNRDIVITEKIDGTQAAVGIDEEGHIWAQSRNKIITVHDDNHGFANWVEQNKTELLKLGPGIHFGEWWGQGINKRYPGHVKTFSLFNVGRWKSSIVSNPADYEAFAPEAGNPPTCCSVVPVLYIGPRLFSFEGHRQDAVSVALELLKIKGSSAQPGNMNPEGIVVFHTASQQLFKVTCEKDESPKGLVKE